MSEKIKKFLIIMAIIIIIVINLIIFVLQILLNCDYYINGYYEYEKQFDNNSFNLNKETKKGFKIIALFIKYLIIIYIIIFCLFGMLMFYDIIKYKKLIYRNRPLEIFVVIFISIMIISLSSLFFSIENKKTQTYNKQIMNKHILNITLGYPIMILLNFILIG